MKKKLTFKYDRTADILYIDTVPPYPDQESDELSMANSITIEIPQEWVEGLEWDQGMLPQEIVQLGIRQPKVQRALDLYKSSNVSLGYAAQQVGIPKRELIIEARVRGIEPPFDEQIVREVLEE